MRPKIWSSLAAVTVVTLSACSGARSPLSPASAPFTPSLAAPGTGRSTSPLMRQARLTFRHLYKFTGGSDGANPLGALTSVNGTLYGTTVSGGAGYGTVFAIDPLTGMQSVLHSFAKSFANSDGAYPFATLTNVGGTLYGTTYGGGTHSRGTVFKITTAGTEKVIYSFGGSGDGNYPKAALTYVNGTFYGTTYGGGAHRRGTVFKITPAGVEKVIYSFAFTGDGQDPQASLSYVSGALYGTTPQGPGLGCNHFGCGTVFKVTPAGVETVLYSFHFHVSGDGTTPYAGLTYAKGTFYGTTVTGGTRNGGTVFAITPAGVETVKHRFVGGNDGAHPVAGLTNVNGTLYGTTRDDGAHGRGTIFSITTAGLETVLYSFAGGSEDPAASLTNVGGTLYGTTYDGGGTGCLGFGCGTVYSLSGF